MSQSKQSGAKMKNDTLSGSVSGLYSAMMNSEFGSLMSGNQTTLLNQLHSKKKKVDSLSDRDRSTWNALVRLYDANKEGFLKKDSPANDPAPSADPIPSADPEIGTIMFHPKREWIGEVIDHNGSLMIRFIDSDGRSKRMDVSDKWTLADPKQIKKYHADQKAASDQPESPAKPDPKSKPKTDPNDMKDVSISDSKELEVIDKAIDGQIMEVVDVLDMIGPDEDLSGLGQLSEKDQADLLQLEETIFEELPKWETTNDILGAAFLEINDRKLFRATHKSFVKYIFETFQVTRAKAYQLMITAEVKAAITNNGADPVEALPSQRAAQTLNQITQSVKGILGDGYKETEIDAYDRTLHKLLWEITLQSAPRDEKDQPIISPAHLESVKEVMNRIVREGVVSYDGEDLPVIGLHSLVDHAITEESKERSNRMKQGIVEDIQKGKTRRSEPQERVSVSKKDGKKLKNKVTITCSEHGEVGAKKFVYGGMVLTCGCAFVKVTNKDDLQQTDIIE